MGKIQSVNSANVAEFVQERKALGTEAKAPEQLAPEKTAEVKAPEVQTPAEPEKKKNSVQERIDELTREKHELNEFAETEYNGRVQAQRRIDELERQIQAQQLPPKQEIPEPKPGDKEYLKEDGSVDQDKFLAAWGKWQRDKAISEFKAEEDKRKQEESKRSFIAEAETRRVKSLELARKEYQDFDSTIEDARASVEMKRLNSPNEAIQALLSESDYSAHILYHLAKHPEDVEKWNKMRPTQIAIAIGKLESKFEKPGDAKAASTEPPKTTLPEPTPSLGTGGGNAPTDFAAPMDFSDYKRKRIDEIRRKRK